jgi:hypothetical protein
MADDTNTQEQPQPPTPSPDLKRLGRLVGTWAMSGDVQGTVTYEWMEGSFFLIQHMTSGSRMGSGPRAWRSSAISIGTVKHHA